MWKLGLREHRSRSEVDSLFPGRLILPMYILYYLQHYNTQTQMILIHS